MKIIISPAKKMNENTETFSYRQVPQFLEKTKMLADYMKSLSYEECKKIWKCNDKIAELNYRRFQEMDVEKDLTPAVFSYEGIQYQYMAPTVMEEEDLGYLEEHLRILSGFYGILRPFDGVAPYRLEMQTKMGRKKAFPELDSLYEFWGELLAQSLCLEDSCILNLASKEYSKCVSRHLGEGTEFVTCVFGEAVGESIVEKGTLAKMARGEMVRFLAETKAETWEDVKQFDRLSYRFSEKHSDKNKFVFIKQSKQETYDNEEDF